MAHKTKEYYPSLVKEIFHFLQTEYEFQLVRDDYSNSGVFIIYQNKFGKVGIIIEYRNNEIFVELVKGKNTEYPSDMEFGNNIKPLKELVKKHDPFYDINKLQIGEGYQEYFQTLRENAAILKKYGDKILKGQEWIE